MSAPPDVLAPWDEQQLLTVADSVRRVAAARLGGDPHAVEDIVQETLARLLAAGNRLDASALLPYALVTARNLVVDAARDQDRSRRYAGKLLDAREPDRPEDLALRAEERRALATALRELPDADRQLLLAHEVDEVDTGVLAAERGSSPGGVAAQLARARGRLRVGYVLALHGTNLPTARCRPVLAALSAGDRRRQRALDTGRHLLSCRTCAELSATVLRRRRGLAALAPWVWLPALFTATRRSLRTTTRQVLAGLAAAAAVVVVAVVVAGTGTDRGSAPTTAAPREPTSSAAPAVPVLTVAGQPLQPGAAWLRRHVGAVVVAEGVPVLAVPADEGFWVGTSPSRRLWVQLATRTESPVRVRPGQRAWFTGRLVGHARDYSETVGVEDAAGAALLRAQGTHTRVDVGTLRVAGP